MFEVAFLITKEQLNALMSLILIYPVNSRAVIMWMVWFTSNIFLHSLKIVLFCW